MPSPSDHTDVWAAAIGPVARALLADRPCRELPTGDLRFGNRGSLQVHTAGPRAGLWTDHETGDSGGVLALVQHIRGGDRAQARA